MTSPKIPDNDDNLITYLTIKLEIKSDSDMRVNITIDEKIAAMFPMEFNNYIANQLGSFMTHTITELAKQNSNGHTQS